MRNTLLMSELINQLYSVNHLDIYQRNLNFSFAGLLVCEIKLWISIFQQNEKQFSLIDSIKICKYFFNVKYDCMKVAITVEKEDWAE